MKKLFTMFFIFILAFVLTGCKNADDYSEEEHIKKVSNIIEEKYIKDGITYKLRPLYDENDKLSYFVVDFSDNTYFYIKIQEKDRSCLFGHSLYTKDTTRNNSGPWRKSIFKEVNGEVVEEFEKDESGNDILYNNSHFEVANIETNQKCYLIKLFNNNELVPAIKEGDKFINIITNTEYNIYSKNISTSDVSFFPENSFNL